MIEPYRHNKTKNLYYLVGECRIEKTNTPAVLYQCVNTGVVWARPKSEFFDGRFSKVKKDPNEDVQISKEQRESNIDFVLSEKGIPKRRKT